jgi:hypothetical protein
MQKKPDKIQHAFMEKDLNKLGIEGMFLNIIKAIYDKLRAKNHTKWRTTETISLKVRNETGLFAFSTPIQFSFRIPSHSNMTRARKKEIQIGKEEVKLSLFGDDVILYLRDPKNSTKKPLEIINSFCKVAGYKINIQSVAFLHTSNEQTEKEIRERIPFTIASKTIKYLGINVMQETKDLFNEL